MTELYHVDDIVASCNACGAYTLTRDPKLIKHCPNCGGIKEVVKWREYYSDPEWEKAVIEETE
jgi:predicted RNA-binding Zn-ribbon protein involved in translation (DUF1610 family)